MISTTFKPEILCRNEICKNVWDVSFEIHLF